LTAVSTFLVLVFWISSWFPASFNNLTIGVTAACIVGLFLAILASKQLRKQGWPAKVLSMLSICFLIAGAMVAFTQAAVGTPVDGAIALFHVIGFAGYLYMLANIIKPKWTSKGVFEIGPLVLFLLAGWSWTSALSMYFHRGALGDTHAACILVPEPDAYDTELSSIWKMRLPEVASSRTSPIGTTILDYHAILVAPSDNETLVYNWSKLRMRFETLDKKRNPYLPTTCP
jgi:hypothetical protein